MKIIKANEAYQKSMEGRQKQIEIELEGIMDSIEKVTLMGKTSITRTKLYEENKDKLKELGYIIEFIADPMWGSHYCIEWGKTIFVKKEKERKKDRFPF